MAETAQSEAGQGPDAGGTGRLIRASQVARETEERRSTNGLRFATYGETGVPAPDLDRMLEAVPTAITSALRGNTYYFVPLALRENPAPELDATEYSLRAAVPEPAMVASAYSEDLGDAAICHRNVELGSGHRGVFISTRLMGDRFALSFEFFINIAHAYVDEAGVPDRFASLVWEQATSGVRGETSLDGWEARNLAQGLPVHAQQEPDPAPTRRGRSFGAQLRPFGSDLRAGSPGSLNRVQAFGAVESSRRSAAEPADAKEQRLFQETAFSDAIAIYLLSLTLDLDYSELRERDYPLLSPTALAERLRLVADLFPANAGYEFAVRYRRRA